ncbi:TRAP transporter large permease subunit [Polaribacter sp.]
MNLNIYSFAGFTTFVNIIYCMLFGAMSGAEVAATSAIGGFTFPLMKKH